MKTIDLASKKVLLAIISAIVIVIGAIVGTVCHYKAGGFFNYGSEFSNYNSVTVKYLISEHTEDGVKSVCESELKKYGAYEVSFSETTDGGVFTYKFSKNSNVDDLNAAAANIQTKLNNSGDIFNPCVVSVAKSQHGGEKILVRASIVVACALAVQFIYFSIRYKFSLAITALCVNIHNVAIYTALLAITRISVGAELVAMSSIVVLISIIAGCILFDKVRKVLGDEANKKLSIEDMSKLATENAFGLNTIMHCALVAATVILFIFAIAASPTVVTVATYASILLAIVVCYYGMVLVAPAMYPMSLEIADSIKKRSADNNNDK